MIPVFQLHGISSAIHIIVMILCMAYIIPSPPYLINSAIIAHSSDTSLFFVFWIQFSSSSHDGDFTSLPSPFALLSVLVSSYHFHYSPILPLFQWLIVH
jgi:hypothetical protein